MLQTYLNIFEQNSSAGVLSLAGPLSLSCWRKESILHTTTMSPVDCLSYYVKAIALVHQGKLV